LCSSNASFGSKAVDFERTALDLDLRENGLPVFPDEIGKRQVVKLKGPVVLQIQKVKNVSAPKASPDSGHSPRLLRLQLTDGHRTFSALEVSPIPQLSLSLAPGTKVRLTGKEMEIVKGFIMIGPSDISVLGGRVEKLASKWELTQSLAKQTRQTDDEGSPPFVPFGKKIPGKHSAAVSSDKTGRSAKPLHTTKPPQEKTEDRPKIDPSSLATFDSKETQASSLEILGCLVIVWTCSECRCHVKMEMLPIWLKWDLVLLIQLVHCKSVEEILKLPLIY
jgi:hypothetical protein